MQNNLIDEYAIDPVELSDIIKTVPGVKKVYKIRTRWVGETRAVDLVISVDSTLSTEESHAIADRKLFCTTDISIHVEPETK